MNSSSFFRMEKKIQPIRIMFTILIIINIFSSIISRTCKQKDSLVKSLPNFSGKADDFPCIYSGFISIDKNSNSQMFYVLISKIDAKDDDDSPLSIWLNGGPGFSSLIGLFTEMGPLKLKESMNTFNLALNENSSWSKLSHILLVDQPVGTGYSFSDKINGMPKNQNQSSIQFYKFVQIFMTTHDDMAHKNIFLLGENYAGKYIPEIAVFIMEENKKIDNNQSSFTHKINLKKIAIGNGLFDTKYQRSAPKDLAKGLNILSEFDDESQYDFLSQQCEYNLSNNSTDSFKNCDKILDYLLKISGDVNKYDVRKSSDSDEALIKGLEHYLNLEETAKAMHVYGTTIKQNGSYFSFSNSTVLEVMKEDINLYSSLPKLEKILNEYDIPVILFAGQFDLLEGPQGMERAVHSMNFSFKKDFINSPRSLWKIPVGNERNVIAGYIKQNKNLALITMRNAGHFAPLGRPGSMYDLIEHILSNEPHWNCPDNNCSLANTKCSFVNNCHGNGICNESTGGKCLCNEKFYGPDCSIDVEKLISGNYMILPRHVKLLHLDDFDNDILLEVDSNDKNIVVSIIDKDDHEYVYDIKKHQVAYKMMNKKLIMYLEKEIFKNSLVVISNMEFKHEINVRTSIDQYNFQKNTFWGPGGFGFFLGLFSFSLGIVMIVASVYIFRRYRQDKLSMMLGSIGEDGYRIMENTPNSNSTNQINI